MYAILLKIACMMYLGDLPPMLSKSQAFCLLKDNSRDKVRDKDHNLPGRNRSKATKMAIRVSSGLLIPLKQTLPKPLLLLLLLLLLLHLLCLNLLTCRHLFLPYNHSWLP